MKRLERRGHVARRSDPLDARKALFFLTEAGRALDVPAANTVEAAVQRVLSRMSKAQLVATQDVLTAMAEELDVGAPWSTSPPAHPSLKRGEPTYACWSVTGLVAATRGFNTRRRP